METLKRLRTTLDSLPWIVTLLLVIFFDGIYGGLYRLTKGTTSGIVIGIIWFLLAYVPAFFGWIGSIVLFVLTICDIVSVIVKKKITVLA